VQDLLMVLFDHLVRCQATFLTSSNGFGLLSMFQTFALAFLKCWTFIVLALVTRFQ